MFDPDSGACSPDVRRSTSRALHGGQGPAWGEILQGVPGPYSGFFDVVAAGAGLVVAAKLSTRRDVIA